MAIFAVLAAGPLPSTAQTQWSGLFFIDDTVISNPDDRTELFRSGLNFSIRPAVKHGVDFRINLQGDYTRFDGEDDFNASPFGNLSMNYSTDAYALTLQHLRSVNITSSAQLVKNATSRVAFSLTPQNAPSLLASYSRQTTDTSDRGRLARDYLTLFSDYRHRWLSLRTGYNRNVRNDAAGADAISDNFNLGAGLSYELLPRTRILGDIDFTRFSSDTATGRGTDSTSRAVRLGLNSRPGPWLGIDATFSSDVIDFQSVNGDLTITDNRFSDLTATLYPYAGVRIWATAGNRSFNDQIARRDIDFTTVATSLNTPLAHGIGVDFLLSHTDESDPLQGDNVRDTMVFNTTLELAPGNSMRVNLNVNRNLLPGFVREEDFDATGPLIDRDLYDDRPAGFTFLDTDLNDLYTKESAAFADWSAPVRVVLLGVEPYSINKTVQMNLRPTPKSSLVLYYGENSNSREFDLGRRDTSTGSAILTYQPNRRTVYSFTGTTSEPQYGDRSRSGTGTFSYRFLRGHFLNFSYNRRTDADRTGSVYTGNLRLRLHRKDSLEVTYSSSRLFESESDFLRVRYSSTF